MFDHIRSADRVVLFLNTVLLMDIAFLPFAASVLAQAFHHGEGQRTAVALHGLTFEWAAMLFNVIWWYVLHDRRLLASSIDAAGAKAISLARTLVNHDGGLGPGREHHGPGLGMAGDC